MVGERVAELIRPEEGSTMSDMRCFLERIECRRNGGGEGIKGPPSETKYMFSNKRGRKDAAKVHEQRKANLKLKSLGVGKNETYCK